MADLDVVHAFGTLIVSPILVVLTWSVGASIFRKVISS